MDLRLIQKAYKIAKEDLKYNWKEVDGSGSNKLILECYKAVDDLDCPEYDWDDSEIPWCSCYANRVIQKAGGRGTRSGAARSWVRWGRKLTTPEEGCIVVLWRGSPDSDSGHVAFFAGYNEDRSKIKLLGGNQNNDVCIQEYPINRVISYRTSKD